MKWTAIGGHMWHLKCGDEVVACVELENGRVPFIVSIARPLQKAELDELFDVMASNWYPPGAGPLAP